MKKVWLVWHIDHKAVWAADEHEKFIGVYSTRKRARAVVERLSRKPGFRDFPDQWEIQARVLNDTWELGGFARVPFGDVS